MIQRISRLVRARPIIVRFSHYQDKEFLRQFLKNLKGTTIGVSDGFPQEIDEINRKLYRLLKGQNTTTKL